MFQGYLFSPPVPLAKMKDLLDCEVLEPNMRWGALAS